MFGIRDNASRAVIQDVPTDALAQATAVMLGATIALVPNLLRQPAARLRFRTALPVFALSALVTALAQATLFEALDRARVTVTAPLTGTGVLWTVVLAAIFLGRSELVGQRLVVVALLVVVGSALVAATSAR
jgi:drug/metabolite transporter (DMT)-like permease